MLIQEYAVPAEARSVSISIDRVALPMEEPIEAPPVPVDPPWVAAVIAAAPPHPPEVQDEVLQLRALQLSDRWAPAVQRATRPLAKPVQIAVSVYAAASTRTAPITGGQGARGAA